MFSGVEAGDWSVPTVYTILTSDLRGTLSCFLFRRTCFLWGLEGVISSLEVDSLCCLCLCRLWVFGFPRSIAEKLLEAVILSPLLFIASST